MGQVVAGGTEALAGLLSRRRGGAAAGERDIFELPELPKREEEEEESEEEGGRGVAGIGEVTDVYQVDVLGAEFAALPREARYELLNELKGKRKQNSWAALHTMPSKAEDFSGFQMERLVSLLLLLFSLLSRAYSSSSSSPSSSSPSSFSSSSTR